MSVIFLETSFGNSYRITIDTAVESVDDFSNYLIMNYDGKIVRPELDEFAEIARSIRYYLAIPQSNLDIQEIRQAIIHTVSEFQKKRLDLIREKIGDINSAAYIEMAADYALLLASAVAIPATFGISSIATATSAAELLLTAMKREVATEELRTLAAGY